MHTHHCQHKSMVTALFTDDFKVHAWERGLSHFIYWFPADLRTLQISLTPVVCYRSEIMAVHSCSSHVSPNTLFVSDFMNFNFNSSPPLPPSLSLTDTHSNFPRLPTSPLPLLPPYLPLSNRHTHSLRISPTYYCQGINLQIIENAMSNWWAPLPCVHFFLPEDFWHDLLFLQLWTSQEVDDTEGDPQS